MTERDWWDLIHRDGKSANDPELRLAFSWWLRDELGDEAGAECLEWFIDVAEVNYWNSDCVDDRRAVRAPYTERGNYWWFLPFNKDYRPCNVVWMGLLLVMGTSDGKYSKYFPTRRAAEERLLEGWREWAGKGYPNRTFRAREEGITT